MESSANHEALFRCDLCARTCCGGEGMAGHLADAGHHSFSRYLGLRGHPATPGRPHPGSLAQASAFQDQRHVLKGPVPAACPVCHGVFADLQQCEQHSARWHGAGGAYPLRGVLNAHTLPTSATWACLDCAEGFEESGPRAMMLFPCPFCGLLHNNYFTFRRHVHSEHAREEGWGGAALVGYMHPVPVQLTFSGSTCTLSQYS